MPSPRAVVIPFGVPDEGRGLGLGLAALVHGSVHLDGGGVALAQLRARRNDEPAAPDLPSPVEAFVPPATWKDIAERGESSVTVSVVLTGSFEPPTDGQGTLHLLAFDSRDGHTRARVDAPVDEDRAGASLVGALEQLWSGLGGEIGALTGLRELGWESLESVLRAERCALHDPARGGPHDRLAAMLHLGRAIEEAPAARYPVERLASIALETAVGPVLDAKAAAAAVRALERAVDDAPAQGELLDALAALLIRLGRPRDAEKKMNAAVAAQPGRRQNYPPLAHALRAQGNIDGALALLDAAVAATGGDAAIFTERGTALWERRDFAGARAAWREALAREPLHPPAYGQLATAALRERDAQSAETLVDAALSAPRVHVDVLRRAVQLAIRIEDDGLARAARVARLCERLLEALPDDAQASLTLARAFVALGDPAGARARLAHVERVAPHSAAAAEAQTTRLVLDDPGAERALQRILRAARTEASEDLAGVAARARRLATLHNAWPGWYAAGVAELRRKRWAAARGAFEVALETAPGATVAHIDLSTALIELEDAHGALAHAQHALALEGESPRVLDALGRALAASERKDEAMAVARRGLAAQPDDAPLRALVEALREKPSRPPLGKALARVFGRWRRA